MIFNLNILILIAIASICLGFLLGYFLRGFIRKDGKSDIQIEQEAAAETETVLKKAPNQNLQEVAQLWRDRRNGKLVFQVESEYYKHGVDLSSKERGLLLKVVMDFYRWLEPEKSGQPQEVKTSQQNKSQNSWASEQIQLQPAIATPLEIMAQARRDKSPKIDLSPVNIFAKALQSDFRQSALSSQSMVTQLDAILQEKIHLAGMEEWAIRLTEFPERGMVVMVGLEQYCEIDEVPYEQVRTVIRESVSEWEQRAETGSLLQ